MPAAIEEHQTSGRCVDVDALNQREQPLVMRGLCRDWAAVRWAGTSDTVFAREMARLDKGTAVDVLLMPPEADGVVGYNESIDAFNFEHHRVSVTQVLKRLATYSRRDNPPGLALQSALLSECLPGFTQSHGLDGLDAGIQPRLWIGNRVTTPAHFDEFHNIACVVCGSRRFTLFPPDQVRNLYIGPLDFAPTGAAMGLARPDRPDDPRFPRLAQAMAHAQQADLQPGDAIYIPPLWWHHVSSLQRLNALVNYWWKPAARADGGAATGMGALLHCILAMKSLPAAQRSAWRELLDYYVFDDTDPAAHIPPHSRGILGTLTPEQVEQVKQSIRRNL